MRSGATANRGEGFPFIDLLKNKWVIAIGCLILFVVFMTVYRFVSSQKTSDSATKNTTVIDIGQFPSSLSISDPEPKVAYGQDQYSGNDLSYVSQNLASSISDEKDNKNQYVAEIIQERAIVLQEAKKMGLIQIDDTLFLPNKDWEKYNQTYEEAKQAIINTVEQMTVAGIYIYFNNDNPPEGMTVVRAKSITYTKMNNLRNRMIQGEITIEQSAEEIRTDTSLASIDEIYQSNAYAVLKNRFRDPQIDAGLKVADNNILWQLEVGDVSPVFLGFEKNVGDEGLRESYWVVYKVLEKYGTLPPYRQWLSEKLNEYESKSL